MDELRVVRREEGSLILANDLGEEFRFAIDESVAQEVRLATPRPTSSVKVRPREIQALLRAGKSRTEVAEMTGLEEADVERFEEPVRAEKQYMLDLAHAVPVRTDPGQAAGTSGATDDEQRFGVVVAERLIGLGNTTSEWRSWRDEETGWLVGLLFDSRDGLHDAVWSFDHKKRVLSPLTADATNLSKIGEIGDRLIPKLRAVDPEQQERPAPEPFDPDALLAPTAEIQPLPAQPADPTLFEDGDVANRDADAEYERRREIDHLAVNTPTDSSEDLSQTADLLDALRRRRGERAQQADTPSDAGSGDDSGAGAPDQSTTDALGLRPTSAPPRRSGAAANIWGTAGVSGNIGVSGTTDGADSRTGETSPLRAVEPMPEPLVELDDEGETRSAAEPTDSVQVGEQPASANAEGKQQSQKAPTTTPGRGVSGQSKGRGKGRSPIPSWDDILFGTRSDDDPA